MSIPQKYKNNIFYKTFHQCRLFFYKVLAFFQERKRYLLAKVEKIRLLLEKPHKIKKVFKIIKENGLTKLLDRFYNLDSSPNNLKKINEQYKIWFKKNWPNKNAINKQVELQTKFQYRPKISIITPVYNPPIKYLKSCINSVINQSYDNWELCLADDCSTNPEIKKILDKYKSKDTRIKVVYRDKNGHISRASNSAVEIATGDFIGLLDHDDDLSPQALYKVVEALNKDQKIDFIYSDEDKVEINGQHVDPFFKPNWSPDMLLSYNYLCHFVVIRKKIVDEIKGFRIGYEGSQDYDLFLRITEKTKNIYHIPEILYSWRKIPGSTATTYSVKSYCNQASINSLQSAMDRRKIKATIENGLTEGTFKVKYKIKDNPLVSIIIPTKDKVNFLKNCINSILNLSTYKNYEILIVETGSVEDKTFKYYKKIKNNTRIKFINWTKPFNYSAVNNFAVKKTTGKYLLFLNNDTKIITNDWIENMLMIAEQRHAGPVGCKLIYSNNMIQHAGVEILNNMWPHHYKTNHSDNNSDTFPFPNYKDIIKNPSAVTAACLLIKKQLFLKLRGFDENFPNEFQDILLSIKATKYNKYPVYTPFSKLIHYESQTIKKDRTWERIIKSFISFKEIIKDENKLFLNKNIKYIDDEILTTIKDIDKNIKKYDKTK